MYERMILADDGSPWARSAVPRAAALARSDGAEVLVVRVSHAAGARPQDLNLDEWRRYVSPQGVADAVAAPLEAEPHLSQVVADLQARGVEHVGSVVLHGNPADALVEAAEALDADLIVLSSRGESGIRRAVMGSVAEQLIREARTTAIMLCPALAPATTEVAGETAADGGQVRRIMLALDGSEVSETALPHAEHLARVLNAELTLVRVDDEVAELKIAEAELQGHADALRSRGIELVAVEVVPSEDPATAILETAERIDADLIVMASHGRGGLGRLLLGSVADAVTRRTERAAVLLVRASD